jgi:hypothetical protein
MDEGVGYPSVGDWGERVGKGSKRKKAPGGQRKSLKRLKTDKRIQGNSSLFL